MLRMYRSEKGFCGLEEADDQKSAIKLITDRVINNDVIDHVTG